MASLVALGPKNSWIVQKQTDLSIAWSKGLPVGAYNFLNNRYGKKSKKKGKTNSALKAFTMGTEGDYFASFEDGSWEYNGIPDLDQSLFKSDVRCFALGPNSSYILITDACTVWSNVPRDAESVMKTFGDKLVWASLGQNDAYFFLFSDGSYCFDKLSDSLIDKIVPKRNVDKVYLSASSDKYFISYKDGTSVWDVHVSFCNAMLTNEFMAPGQIAYLTSSIKSKFVCGRPLQATMEGLKSKKISVEDIPAISVVKYKDVIYSLNNRRLWAFKNAGVSRVPVIVKKPNAAFRKKLNKKLYSDMYFSHV